jgi:ATP/maltotriose-dependent transcriptional regulator MalT
MGMPEVQSLKGALAAIRTFTAVVMGQDDEALAQAQQARALLADEDLFEQSLVAWALGNTLLTQGRLPEARLAFEEHTRLGRAMSNHWTLLAGQTLLAQVLQSQGQLPRARALLEETLAEASQQGVRGRGYVARVENGLASVLYEQNELEAANRLLAEAIVLTASGQTPTTWSTLIRSRPAFCSPRVTFKGLELPPASRTGY